MIDYYFAHEHRVLMARATGVYDTEDMLALDDFVRRFVAIHGPVRGIYDFSDVEQITVPVARLAERAKDPSIAGGLRVMVAPKVIGIGMTRTYSNWQSDGGQTAMMMVSRLEEAYVLLGLDYKAKFEPVALDQAVG